MPATLSAPSSTSPQLLFDFESVSVVAPVSKPVAHQSTAKRPSPTSRQPRPQHAGTSSANVIAFVADNVNSARSSLLAAVCVPESKLPPRGAGEVKLGAVMIQLLKRYGITDAEIEEGIAEYASSRQA